MPNFMDEPTAGLDVIARDSILELLQEYMETEGRSILIPAPISSDLESLCDDIYMIDKGQIVLHENTDVLLDEYGLIKADEKQYELLDKQHILKVKKEQYGYSCLTDERAFYAENYPQLAIERGSVDKVITMMIKGNFHVFYKHTFHNTSHDHHSNNLVHRPTFYCKLQVVLRIKCTLICETAVTVLLLLHLENMLLIKQFILLLVSLDKTIFIQQHICILMKHDLALNPYRYHHTGSPDLKCRRLVRTTSAFRLHIFPKEFQNV